MSWEKREAVSNLVILGDGDGQQRSASGLLASVVQDSVYPERMNYELVQRGGESITLAGSASISRQIGPSDVGKFVKLNFDGWGKSANGKFKMIDVQVYVGEPNDTMKAWPRYAELSTKAQAPAPAPVKAKAPAKAAAPAQAQGFEEFPAAIEDGNDDLPF